MFMGMLMMRWNFAVVRQQLSWLRKPAHSDDFTVHVNCVCWFAGMACVSVSAMLHQFRGALRRQNVHSCTHRANRVLHDVIVLVVLVGEVEIKALRTRLRR